MTRIIVVGFGQMGREVVRAFCDRTQSAALAAVVDVDPELAGRHVTDLLDLPASPVGKLVIQKEIPPGSALHPAAQSAIVTTSSRLAEVKTTLFELAAAGYSVVSSCEELAYPFLRQPKLAAEMDRHAKKHGVAILGTGINPGFAMDSFVLTCTAACIRVRSLRVIRHLDAMNRRQSLQRKIAAGLTPEEYRAASREKKIGHIGLRESVAMLAAGLGWQLDKITEKQEPLLADYRIKGQHCTVEPGQVRGMRMVAEGCLRSKPKVTLDLVMAFDTETFDEVIVDGDPPLLVRTKSGFPGDQGTVAMLVHCARLVHRLEPGLRTMLDLLGPRAIGV